jgi:predicted Zn-dependent peptidase
MMWMGEQLLGYGHTISPAEIKQRIAEIKPSQVRAVARDFFRPERTNLALISPLKSKRGLLQFMNQ